MRNCKAFLWKGASRAPTTPPTRLFTYNYRLYDRYATPIASLAVLADDEDGWKPDHYGYEVLGCRHHLNFPAAKLNELAAQIDDLEAETNPFALITVAHQRTRQTRNNPESTLPIQAPAGKAALPARLDPTTHPRPLCRARLDDATTDRP
jgi:hypothetical protein